VIFAKTKPHAQALKTAAPAVAPICVDSVGGRGGFTSVIKHNKYNPEQHNRHSIRLRGYDYAGMGAYFVTICLNGRVGQTSPNFGFPMLGAVENGVMVLNDFGKIVEKYIRDNPVSWGHPKRHAVRSKRGFTLIEVLIVIVLIGILSALAYSSLMDVIFTNRAKETAQIMRTFAERALTEGKRQEKTVTIRLNSNNIGYSLEGDAAIVVSEPLSGGFTSGNAGSTTPNCVSAAEGEDFDTFNGTAGVESEFTIGISGMAKSGYFIACGAKNYCAAAVKVRRNNFFVACIMRGNDKWEAL